MSLVAIVLLILALGAGVIGLVMVLKPGSTEMLFGGSGRSQMRKMMSTQRQDAANSSHAMGSAGAGTRGTVRQPRARNEEMLAEDEKKLRHSNSSQLTLLKRLKFAQWKMAPAIFYLCIIVISIVLFLVASLYFNIVIRVIVLLFSGSLIMNYFLNRSVHRRFKAFDKDYPAFLLSIVGLIKTGMNPITALEAGAQGLEVTSLVRLEVEQMLERLRVGIPEDQSIGSFGEDVFHPEIELFVQALLLSRRVGGTLSDTLERLAKQVRKRQYFRGSANAAIGQQRGSVFVIIGLLICIETYLYISFPEAVTAALDDDMGWQAWQTAFLLIGLGVFWITQVTKMKI